jgi:hypothetical protein
LEIVNYRCSGEHSELEISGISSDVNMGEKLRKLEEKEKGTRLMLSEGRKREMEEIYEEEREKYGIEEFSVSFKRYILKDESLIIGTFLHEFTHFDYHKAWNP